MCWPGYLPLCFPGLIDLAANWLVLSDLPVRMRVGQVDGVAHPLVT